MIGLISTVFTPTGIGNKLKETRKDPTASYQLLSWRLNSDLNSLESI